MHSSKYQTLQTPISHSTSNKNNFNNISNKPSLKIRQLSLTHFDLNDPPANKESKSVVNKLAIINIGGNEQNVQEHNIIVSNYLQHKTIQFSPGVGGVEQKQVEQALTQKQLIPRQMQDRELCKIHPNKKVKFLVVQPNSELKRQTYCSKCILHCAINKTVLPELKPIQIIQQSQEAVRQEETQTMIRDIKDKQASLILQESNIKQKQDHTCEHINLAIQNITQYIQQAVDFLEQKKNVLIGSLQEEQKVVRSTAQKLISQQIQPMNESLNSFKCDIEGNFDCILTEIEDESYQKIMADYKTKLITINERISKLDLLTALKSSSFQNASFLQIYLQSQRKINNDQEEMMLQDNVVTVNESAARQLDELITIQNILQIGTNINNNNQRDISNVQQLLPASCMKEEQEAITNYELSDSNRKGHNIYSQQGQDNKQSYDIANNSEQGQDIANSIDYETPVENDKQLQNVSVLEIEPDLDKLPASQQNISQCNNNNNNNQQFDVPHYRQTTSKTQHTSHSRQNSYTIHSTQLKNIMNNMMSPQSGTMTSQQGNKANSATSKSYLQQNCEGVQSGSSSPSMALQIQKILSSAKAENEHCKTNNIKKCAPQTASKSNFKSQFFNNHKRINSSSEYAFANKGSVYSNIIDSMKIIKQSSDKNRVKNKENLEWQERKTIGNNTSYSKFKKIQGSMFNCQSASTKYDQYKNQIMTSLRGNYVNKINQMNYV